VHAPGVQWNVVTEMISETCTDVAQAVEACARVCHLRSMSYLLADAGGAVGVVEATPTEVRFREGEPCEGGAFVVAANAPQGGRLVRRYEPGSAEPKAKLPLQFRHGALEHAERRIERVRRLLKERLTGRAGCALSVDEVAAMLRDHEGPVCAGDHAHPDGAPWGTIWSGICEPARDAFLIAPGLPCRHAYQRFAVRP